MKFLCVKVENQINLLQIAALKIAIYEQKHSLRYQEKKKFN